MPRSPFGAMEMGLAGTRSPEVQPPIRGHDLCRSLAKGRAPWHYLKPQGLLAARPSDREEGEAMKTIVTLLVLAVLIVVGGYFYIHSGLYDVAATAGSRGFLDQIAHQVSDASVE